ncbi:hypothetical protein DSO57_1032961 [Entomophthora muscae]|uniref:Uncharacterized protein n=1 Tax=Entomophthora muscae TaxID=34485 RepID=A0ACC2TB29_9FUNG|nr:hypothetical protein DSO57_1032961 [Entomophthora muscae]
MNLWFNQIIPYLLLVLFHLQSTSCSPVPHVHITQEIADQLPKLYCPPGAPFGPVHFTKYPPNPVYLEFTLEEILIHNPEARTREIDTVYREGIKITIPPLLFQDKNNFLPAYLVPMTPPHTLQPNRPQNSVAADESTSTQIFGPLSCGGLSLLGPRAVHLQVLRNPPQVGSLTHTVIMQKPATTKLSPAVNVKAPAATKQIHTATMQKTTPTKPLPAGNVQASTKQINTVITQMLAAIEKMPTATSQVPTILTSPTCKPSSNQASMSQPLLSETHLLGNIPPKRCLAADGFNPVTREPMGTETIPIWNVFSSRQYQPRRGLNLPKRK